MSTKMASSAVPSRFAELTDADLGLLLENKDATATKNVIQKSVNVFRKYCKEKSLVFDDIIHLPVHKLSPMLARYYAELRKADGELYAKKSMQSLRYGLQRFFEKERGFDIVNDGDFKEANNMFKSVCVELKKAGRATVNHKPPILPGDMHKIRTSTALNQTTPRGLQNKVFVDIMVYFCNRGRENLREMSKDDFIVEVDAQGEKFVKFRRDKMTKNHRGDDDEQSQGGFMYATPHKPDTCPVQSFEKYHASLNPKCEAFWQKPKDPSRIGSNGIWYENMAVGKNTLYTKTREISTEAGCSKLYTNHCLRASNLTALDAAGFEARDIMTVSGHHSESSIRSYSRTSQEKKRKMSHTLSKMLTSDDGGNKEHDTMHTMPSPTPSLASKPSTSTSVTAVSLPTRQMQLNSPPRSPPFLSLSQQDKVLCELNNSPVMSRDINIGAVGVSHDKSRHSQAIFNIQNCVVNIHNS